MKFNKILPFELKEVKEEGEFTGYASVFGNKDSEGDIIAKGAFKKTIGKRGGKFPILWQHNMREPIGVNLAAEEDDYGLKVHGKLAMEMPNAKAAYAWMKMATEAGLSVGLSIGFRIISKENTPEGGRIIKEIALVEYSIVTFPANELAMVVGVKSISDVKSAMDFNEALAQELNERKLRELGWTIDSARYDALCSVEKDENLTNADKIKLISEIYTQYGSAMVAWWTKYFEVMKAEDDEAEEYSGAKLSKRNKKILETAMDLVDQGCRMTNEARRLSYRGLSLINAVTAGVTTEKDADDDLDQPPAPDPGEIAPKYSKEFLEALNRVHTVFTN